VTFGSRDSIEVDALQTDRYLDALLAAAERHAVDTPSAAEIDPALRVAVRRLRRDLVRVHPSFRFEERLARRLAETAARIRAADGREAAWSPAEAAPSEDAMRLAIDPAIDPTIDPSLDPAALSRRRPLLVGGAMASAALSLAGAAIVVARRRSRPVPPMTRAARAAHRATRVAGRAARARRAPLA
jgi:hypothetical protein